MHHLRQDISSGRKRLREIAKGSIEAGAGCGIALRPIPADALGEPLVFALTGEDDITVDQLMFGYMPQKDKTPTITVLSDNAGIVLLPNIGYFRTDRISSSLTVRTLCSGAGTSYSLHQQGTPVSFSFSPLFFTSQMKIELALSLPRPFRHLFDGFGAPSTENIANAAAKYAPHITKALQIIEDVCPAYHDHIANSIRRIYVFEHPRIHSFASIRAHGAIFLNAVNEKNEIFFVEDIAHQAGHVLFNEATIAVDGLFQIDQDTRLSLFTGNQDDTRTVYVALHGIFTEISIVSCLDAYLERSGPGLSGANWDELEGRLAFYLFRCAHDLSNLMHPEIFCERGNALFQLFLKAFIEVYSRRGTMAKTRDFSNQPYVFDYEKYKRLNPKNPPGEK